MDDPNITMEEYIRLEEEKARRRGKVYNWETAMYGKIWYDEDVLDLRSVETEFPAIAFNDSLTSGETPSCEPTVSSLNDEINFRISFVDFDDEDYTVVFDKNSFSYKIIYVNNLKTDSENDNEKVNMPSFPPLEPTSKSDFLTEPTVSPQHINEFNLKNETSLSECDEKEQNVLYFNDLFPFNVIYPDDLKSDKDNDFDEIDIEQSSGGYGFEHEHVVMNPTSAGMRHHHLHLYIQRISLRTGFPAQKRRISSNTDVYDFAMLAMFSYRRRLKAGPHDRELDSYEISQSPPPASCAVDDDNWRDFHFALVNTKEYHTECCSGRITRIMRRTLVNSLSSSSDPPVLLSCLLKEQLLEPALNLTVHCCGLEFRVLNGYDQKSFDEERGLN
ncbi:hypothetical protein Tco_0397128 [Tanacetum coccineum]